jgi:hypothetical protein
MVESLQKSIEKMGTMAAHQSILLGLLKAECNSPEQEALLFSLHSCGSNGFDWRVEADKQVADVLARLESMEVAHV